LQAPATNGNTSSIELPTLQPPGARELSSCRPCHWYGAVESVSVDFGSEQHHPSCYLHDWEAGSSRDCHGKLDVHSHRVMQNASTEL
jgi:hypothetical protein